MPYAAKRAVAVWIILYLFIVVLFFSLTVQKYGAKFE